MSPTLLVAWREYKQYVFSRGFLLFLIATPALMLGAGLLFSLIDDSRPQRTFVVYDQTDQYAPLIDEQLEKRALRQMLTAWDIYLQLALDPEKGSAEDLPAPFAPGTDSHARIQAFQAAGGFEAAGRVVAPLLREGAPAFVPPRPQFRRLALPEAVAKANSMEEAARILEPYLLGDADIPGADPGGLFAAVLIPADFGNDENAPQAQFWSKNLTDPALEVALTRALRSVLRREAAAELGISGVDLERISDIETPISVYQPGTDDSDEALDDADRLEKVILPGVMTYVLVVLVFAVGNPLLTNTIEERSNKIVEVLLSSVTADQLMVGKLLGIGAVGLTMPSIFLIGGLVIAGFGVSGTEVIQEIMGALLHSGLLPVFFFYFLAAYIIFAMMFLAIGALSNSIQDAQTFMGPLMMLVFAPLPFVIVVFQNPNGLVATILTFIPLYTPYAVMMRIQSDPPLVEILGGTALMIAFAVFLSRMMGRIFKNNILNHAPPKATEIWRLTKKSA